MVQVSTGVTVGSSYTTINYKPYLINALQCLELKVPCRYGCLRERVMHHNELLLAQGIPVYPDVAAAAGFEDGVPVNFKGVSDAQKRRMAGNSFQQACSNGLMTFVLASMRKK